MFGLSFGEVLIILVVALMVLGPSGMPKLARTLGKGLRDFRRATGELRGAFEDEFYQLDKSIENAAPRAPTAPPAGAIPVAAAAGAVSADPAPVAGEASPAAAAVGAVSEPGAGEASPAAETLGTQPMDFSPGAAEGSPVTREAVVPDPEATPVQNPPATNEGREG